MFVGFLVLIASAVAMAGTLTITSPAEGAYLGTTNTLKFQINGASVDVSVKAVITGPTGGKTQVSQTFTPDNDGKISGSFPLNFSTSAPQGAYTITVSATEPNNTYADATVHATVVVIAPKFGDFSPNDGQFVKGTVHIHANIVTTNIKDWTVQVNGQDIPNNTGTTNTVDVAWDTTSLQNDGSQSITITARDLANNSVSKTISVTVSRVAPTITIVYPLSSTKIVSGADITVLVDVTGESSGAVDVTGIDIIAKKPDGTFITRVARISYRSTGGTTSRWTGRIRYQRNLLPAKFQLVATAVDRAGNSAAPQTVIVTVGR